MFTLTIQVSSIDEAERILAALKHTADPAAVRQVEDQVITGPSSSIIIENPEKNSEANEPPPLPAGATVVEPKKRGRPSKAAQASAAPANDVPTEAIISPVDHSNGSTSAQQTLSIDDARNALKEVQAKYGTADMAKPLELLGQFGANRVSEVKSDDYAAFIAACKVA